MIKWMWDRARRIDPVYSENAHLLGYTLLGGLAPLWISWIRRAFRTGSFPNVTEFAHGGEFSLYAAALVAPAAYLILYDGKKTPFPKRLSYGLAMLVLWVFSILAYMLVAPDDPSDKATIANFDVY